MAFWIDRREYEIGPSVGDNGWTEYQEKCSACGEWVDTNWKSPKFCPECGAKMNPMANKN